MNIKMKEKDIKNSKKKIELTNLLVSKNRLAFKSKNINIQTITVGKPQKYCNKVKKFFSSKNLKQIKYLCNTSINYNINSINYNNNYYQNEDDISIFNSSGSERGLSPINSNNISSYKTHTKKKKKQKRYKKDKIKKSKYNNIINNSSFNSNIDNSNNNSIILNSSSSSSDNDYSESSEGSYCRSRDNKRKKYLEKMMVVEENELDYLKKSEVGLESSEEEDNNNSIDNNNCMEENFNNEIERILIEIYNKNISLISSGNYSEINRNSSEIEDIEKQIKKYLKKESFNTNLLVLKSLSNKIKELVKKYREKVFEIEEIKNICANELKRQFTKNNQIIRCNNSVGSNVATNSNSSYESCANDDDKNNQFLDPQDEIKGKGITNILLRELINIKMTLKISSKEIEGIFRYPLNILKNENGKKIKFSVELMQCEEFSKTILNDELISALLYQIKHIFNQHKIPKITKWLEELEDKSEHNNEMTKFIKYINEKLGIQNDGKEIINNNEKDVEYLSADILEKNIDIKETIYNDSNEKNKKTKKTKNIDKNFEKTEENENMIELNFNDIDELLNYINDETDSKKTKKKQKKGKKGKKQNNKKEEEKIFINNNNNNENNENNNSNLDEDFLKEYEIFKKDIKKATINITDINKVIPCLSNDFLDHLSIY
jgi:hypothetical protein